jgi:signal transduction histidine kinase
MSLRIKLWISYALVVVVTLTSVVLIAREGAAREVRTFMTDQGMIGEDDLARMLTDYFLANGSWQGVETVMPDMMGGRMGKEMMGGRRIRVADGSGLTVYDSMGFEGELLDKAEISRGIVLKDAKGDQIGFLLAESGRMLAMPGMHGIPLAGANLLGRLTSASLTAALIGGGIALLLALFFGYQLLKPVGALTYAARGMAAGDLSQRVTIQGNDELAELGRDFNRMAEALERSEQNRRAMTADVAHELRTPIAVQRAHLEALQDGVYPLTAENLQPVLDQTELLTRLVDDLRTLALADAGELQLERAVVSPVDLAKKVIERFRADADQRQVEMRLEIEPKPQSEILVDAARIEQILNNLIGNALRYTPDGKVITLQVRQDVGSVIYCVRDSGPGIPPEALEHIFERFYRADRSRSREEGGTGLGLAIARQLAQAHGGELTAANYPGGGAEFILRLPNL